MKVEGTVGRRRLLAAAVGALCAYLSLETFLPPASQPTARACLAAIRGYQAVGSPAMAEMGVACKYRPTCSHYAVAALSHYGTLEGLVRTAGRLWRCSPWGGAGYDPAVVSLRQEPAPPKRIQNDDLERQQREAAAAAAAAAGICGASCLVIIVTSLGGLAIVVFMMLYVLKDGKARGDSNVALWAVLVWLFPLVGFIVYFFARPKGDLVPCGNCKDRRLVSLVKCPHCGADAAGGTKV
jgi:putative membrane protein insertion efficiency factor